jgi:hypothetical protein
LLLDGEFCINGQLKRQESTARHAWQLGAIGTDFQNAKNGMFRLASLLLRFHVKHSGLEREHLFHVERMRGPD